MSLFGLGRRLLPQAAMGKEKDKEDRFETKKDPLGFDA